MEKENIMMVKNEEKGYYVAQVPSSLYEQKIMPLTLEMLAHITAPQYEEIIPFEYHSLIECFKGEKVLLPRQEYELRVKATCDKLNVLLRYAIIADQVLMKVKKDFRNTASPVAAYYSILTGANVYKIEIAVFNRYAQNLFGDAVHTTRYCLDLVMRQELSLYVNTVPWFLHFPFDIGELFPRVVTLLLACYDEQWLKQFCEYLNIKDMEGHVTVQVIRRDAFLFSLSLYHLPVQQISKWSVYKRFYTLLWNTKEEEIDINHVSACYLFFILLSKHRLESIEYLRLNISMKRRRFIGELYKRKSFLPTYVEINELYNICCESEVASAIPDKSSESPDDSSSLEKDSSNSGSFLSSIIPSIFGSLSSIFNSSSSNSATT